MRKTILLFLGMFAFLAASGQKADTTTSMKKDTSLFVRVEKIPEFPGGIDNMIKYFAKNLKYPKEAKRNNIEGTVYVSFVVERDGSLSDIKIKRSLSPETDAEAIRLMGISPKWIPGMQGGRPVRVRFSLPVYFRLNN